MVDSSFGVASFVCLFLFFVFCVWSFFVVLSVISGFAINLMGKKELVALH